MRLGDPISDRVSLQYVQGLGDNTYLERPCVGVRGGE